MAIQDNTALPAAPAAAGGMPPQIAAFLQMLMGGGGGGGIQGLLSHLFGGGGGAEPGGLPFGGAGQGFGHFLMNNPALLQGLGLAPQGAVPGPLPGAAPVQDSTPVGAAAPVAPTTPSQDPAAPATPVGNTPAAAPAPQGMAGLASLMAGARPGGLGDGAFQSILPMLRKG